MNTEGGPHEERDPVKVIEAARITIGDSAVWLNNHEDTKEEIKNFYVPNSEKITEPVAEWLKGEQKKLDEFLESYEFFSEALVVTLEKEKRRLEVLHDSEVEKKKIIEKNIQEAKEVLHSLKVWQKDLQTIFDSNARLLREWTESLDEYHTDVERIRGILEEVTTKSQEYLALAAVIEDSTKQEAQQWLDGVRKIIREEINPVMNKYAFRRSYDTSLKEDFYGQFWKEIQNMKDRCREVEERLRH